jgi:hypothetical protein
MRWRILPVAAAVGVAGTFLACSDDSPSGPSGTVRPQATSHVTPINPLDRQPKRDGLVPSFVFTVPPGDSTADPCFTGEYCGVQGRAAGGVSRIFCLNGPGTCLDHHYRWSIANPPPNTTTTFNPEVTVNEQWTTFQIQTDSTTVPGTYQPVIVSTLDDPGSPSGPYTADTIPVRIRCNFKFNSCPQIEIVDLTKGPDSVISVPKPKQNTFIGKKVKLGIRWKQGTGTGTYSLAQVPAAPPPYQWSLSGSIVKSYDITTGTLDSLRLTDRQADTVAYYYARAASTNTVYAVGTLVRDDNRQISFPEATASYNAQGPTSVVMTSTTSSVLVGPWGGDTADTRLAFGDPTLPGISFRFTATAPPGDSGYVGGTQLVNSWTTSTPPSSTLTTGGAYWLDGCALYDNYQTGLGGPPGTGSQFLWQTQDSPNAKLTPTFDLVSAGDSARMYFMYRPKGAESIWVPIGRLDWFWQGTASRTGNPLVNHGWTGPTNAANSASPTGAGTSVFPVWSQTFPTGAACPILPSN